MDIWLVVALVIYTTFIIALTAMLFFRKFDKLRIEHFNKVVGCLHIEQLEQDEEPYVFLELYKGAGDISSREFVHLAVDTKSYVTQK